MEEEAVMLDVGVKPKVEFTPVEKKRQEWVVRAVLPTGKELQIGAFNCEAEAREWIERKSAFWLSLKGCERGRYDH